MAAHTLERLVCVFRNGGAARGGGGCRPDSTAKLLASQSKCEFRFQHAHKPAGTVVHVCSASPGETENDLELADQPILLNW